MTTELSIVYLTPERFEAAPQVGLPIVQEWHSLLRWLTWPTFADDKRAAGAWCPAALVGGRVKGGTGPMSLLVGDVDDAEPGALDRTAATLAHYQGAIIPTFNATVEKPKHRIVLVPSRPLETDEFPVAWGKMNSDLAAVGIPLDQGCKNLNRLYFACVARKPATWMGARLLTGAPVDVDAMLKVAREEEHARRLEREARAALVRPVSDAKRDHYVAAAMEFERRNILAACEGGRHDALLRAVYALARFSELGEHDIATALLQTFVAVAGESRRREGERAIRDAYAARQQVSA